jgi:hypothetical protein
MTIEPIRCVIRDHGAVVGDVEQVEFDGRGRVHGPVRETAQVLWRLHQRAMEAARTVTGASAPNSSYARVSSIWATPASK